MRKISSLFFVFFTAVLRRAHFLLFLRRIAAGTNRCTSPEILKRYKGLWQEYFPEQPVDRRRQRRTDGMRSTGFRKWLCQYPVPIVRTDMDCINSHIVPIQDSKSCANDSVPVYSADSQGIFGNGCVHGRHDL